MRKAALITNFLRDQDGSPLVEAALMIPFLFVFLLGSVDFLHAFIQWNQAAKAVEVGARIAAVSDSVSNGLPGLATAVVTAGTVNCPTATPRICQTGDPMPQFQVTCDGALARCDCTGTCNGITSGTGDYNAAAMNLIVFGRDGQGACGDSTSYYMSGMCDIFPQISASKVKVTYTQSGLGFAGRGAGPIPTISVSIENLQFEFFFLNGLMGWANLAMPSFLTTITGEVMSAAAANAS